MLDGTVIAEPYVTTTLPTGMPLASVANVVYSLRFRLVGLKVTGLSERKGPVLSSSSVSAAVRW